MAKSKKVVEDLTEETTTSKSESSSADANETLTNESSSATGTLNESDSSADESSEASETAPTESRKPQEMPAWLVKVDCPTPLASNPKTVRAFDEAGAWSAFCAMNGITGTDHPKTITRI